MVIVDVKMLSGFIPVKSSVRKVGCCLSNEQHLSSRHLPNVCSKLEGFTVCISLLLPLSPAHLLSTASSFHTSLKASTRGDNVMNLGKID